MVKVNKWDRPCYKCRSHFCDLSCKEILQPKAKQEPTSGFFSREAMKEHSDFHPQSKTEQDKPVAQHRDLHSHMMVVAHRASDKVTNNGQKFVSQKEAMKLALDFISRLKFADAEPEPDIVMSVLKEALAKQEQDEPVAVVTGVYGGRFTYAPIKASVILPVGMALYTRPQHREWIDLNGEELEILLRENSSLTLGAIWAVADKLKKKNT